MGQQPGFFDVEERSATLSAKGDVDFPLEVEGPLTDSYRLHEVTTDAGSQGKAVRERSRPGSARTAFQAWHAASRTAP